MGIRRLIAVLAVIAAAGCQGPSPTPQSPSTTPSATRSPSEPRDYPAGRSEPVRDPVYPQFGNPAIDVLHYDLALRWNPERTELTGTAGLTVRMVEPGRRIELDLSSRLKTSKVTVDGRPATVSRQGHKIRIDSRTHLRAGHRALVRIDYRGVPRAVEAPTERDDFPVVGVELHNADGSAFSMQEPFGAFTWYPVVDHPSDEAVYDTAITVPEGWAGVTSGEFVGRRGSTYRWRSTDPIASYVVAFAVGPYKMIRDTGPHRIPITYWVRRDLHPEYESLLREVPEMLAWQEKRLGPYPFESAGVVVVPGRSAMETQSMVTMSGGSKRPDGEQRTQFRDVLFHELTHQWYGDSVSPLDWKGIWLNEGFTMYVDALRHRTGIPEYLSAWGDDATLRAQSGPPGNYDPDEFGEPNVYNIPALMLHEIRIRIGDRKFFGLLRAWAQRQRNTQQDRASFIAFVNSYTGKDFTSLIDRWLDSRTTPRG